MFCCSKERYPKLFSKELRSTIFILGFTKDFGACLSNEGGEPGGKKTLNRASDEVACFNNCLSNLHNGLSGCQYSSQSGDCIWYSGDVAYGSRDPTTGTICYIRKGIFYELVENIILFLYPDVV